MCQLTITIHTQSLRKTAIHIITIQIKFPNSFWKKTYCCQDLQNSMTVDSCMLFGKLALKSMIEELDATVSEEMDLLIKWLRQDS